ncbi:MAG: hypothetical protein R6V35_05425 [Candidatus Nanohaloarchaea archaeon]
MSNDEVQLGSSNDEDYEVVPVGPIRKLERRIDEIQEQSQEAQGSSHQDELIRDVLDIMKSNQKIVNDMTESTHELKNSVEDLTHKMDETIDNMNAFMDLLNEASEMDMEGEIVGDMEGRIADAIGNKMDEVAQNMHESNQEVVSQLDNLNESIRKSYASQSANNSSQVQRSQRPQQNQRPQQSQAQQSQRPDQGQSSNMQQPQGGQNKGQGSQASNDFSNDDRMKRLREKFGNVEEE